MKKKHPLKNHLERILRSHPSLLKGVPPVIFAAGATAVAAVCVGVGLFARRQLTTPSIMETLVKYNPQGF